MKSFSCIQATPSANVKSIWSILIINSFLPFFGAVLVACSSKPQDKEIRKLNETLLIQYHIICLVYVLKHINLLEMRKKKVLLLEHILSFYLFKTF